MKNLKKVLALVVVFAMMVSSVAFAAIYPDVAADADYAKAVSVLSDLGMIKGDDKGNFNPDATITRAEFATMITRLLGVEGAATGKANFTDVAADHWATGYIAMAQQQGIISGYGDGTFGPENPVKYEEAVKMLVCALGYEPMAVSKGGWVAGYLTTAYQIGLLSDVTGTQGAGAPRSLVAQLCYNALDIPMMEQTGFGTEVKLEIMKRTEDHDKVTLLTKMGIYKLGGIVAANSKVSYKTTMPYTAAVQDKGIVEFWWDDDFDSPVKTWAKKTGAVVPVYDKGNPYFAAELLLAGETDIEDAIGNQLVVYVKKNVSKYEVLAYEIDDVSTSFVISSKALDDDATDDSFANVVKYFKDGATKSTKVNIAPSATTLVNNTSMALSNLGTAVNSVNSDVPCSIEFIDYNADNYYDVISVTKYYHAVVEEVDEAKGIAVDKNDNKINFNVDDPDAKVTIKDINGNELTLADIKQNDVLAMVLTGITSTETAALKQGKYDTLDVIVLKDSFVSGGVDGYSVEGSVKTVTVGDKDLDAYATLAEYGKIGLQSEGTFFVGISGDIIVGFEGDKIANTNYAVIMNAYLDARPSAKTEIDLLTKDGIATYTLANSFRIKGFKLINSVYEAYTYNVKADDTIAAEFANTAWSGLSGAFKSAIATQFASDIDAAANVETTTIATKSVKRIKPAVAAARTIKFKVNSENEIIEIAPMATGASDYNYELSYDAAAGEYDADGVDIVNKTLDEKAIVIVLDADDYENSYVTDLSYFVDENVYSALMLDVDADGDFYSAAVVAGSDAQLAKEDPIAIVSDVKTVLAEDGEEVLQVKAYKGEEEVTLIFNSDSTVMYSTAAYTTLDKGSVFFYSADSKGIVSKYAVIAKVNYDSATADGRNGSKEFAFDTNFKANFTSDYTHGDAFFYAYIENKTANAVTVNILDEVCDVTIDANFKKFNVGGAANQYTITGLKKSSSTVELSDYAYGNIDKEDTIYWDDDNNPVTDPVAALAGYTVLIRTYEGKVLDIVGLDTPNPTRFALYTDNVAAASAPVVAPVAPVVEEKAEVKEEIVELEGFDL